MTLNYKKENNSITVYNNKQHQRLNHKASKIPTNDEYAKKLGLDIPPMPKYEDYADKGTFSPEYDKALQDWYTKWDSTIQKAFRNKTDKDAGPVNKYGSGGEYVDNDMTYRNRHSYNNDYVYGGYKVDPFDKGHTYIKESLEELINGDYDSFANGDYGHTQYIATVIKFNNGETYVLDETHDDIDSIRKDLKKKGYVEGRNFTVEEQEQREF